MSSDSLLRCMSPLLSQRGQTEPTAVCPLSGAKRTLLALRPIVMPRIHCGYNANRLRSFCSYWLSKAPHARGEAPILKGSKRQGPGKGDCREGWLMDTPMTGFVRVSSLEELKAKGRLVVHGPHRPILVVHDKNRVFALDNRCPHMGFPLDRGSVEDGTLTCHWHHARFDLASGCTFDLWADDVPTCLAEVRDGEVSLRPIFSHADAAAHWRQRLDDGLAHVVGLVIAKAVHGQLAAGVPPSDVVRQVALFGIQNRDGWGVGLTILTGLGNLLPVLPEEETYLALFHGARRVAADCDGQAPRRQRAALTSRLSHARPRRSFVLFSLGCSKKVNH